MSRFQRNQRNQNNTTRMATLDLSTQSFPDLSMNPLPIHPKPVEWGADMITKTNAPIRQFTNGDIFEGEFDKNGNPINGKLTFKNGNIYYGPIFTSWPQDPEPYYEEMPDPNDEYSFVYYYEEHPDVDPYRNYGEMVYPDGTSFWGVFCFDHLIKI
jgi:hypothetical protein